MILDNSSDKTKIINWITKETPEKSKFNIVTGYFTVGALANFINTTQGKLDEVKIILGDFLQEDPIDNPLDILNGDLSIEKAFQISESAKKVIEFLEKEKVQLRVLEPNFCHAKIYLAIPNNSNTKGYYITGSSNLTEAGLGIKSYHNVELNIAGQPTDPQHPELKQWFDNLWKDDRAKTHIKNEEGKKVNVKQYVIELLQSFFKKYTPEEIYYKILYELFRNQIDNGNNLEFEREMGRLENSLIFRKLYEFQRKGVISLIKMLNKYNGAILADAVGLGKTWSTLGVIKYYKNKGYQTIILVPKKLHHNWLKYHYLHNSIFQEDKFDYVIRFHTDLQDDRLETKDDGLKIDEFFQSDTPKLFVIDESHNLRNHKSNRYNFLVDKIINHEHNPNHKVLLLSATPINTSLNDIKNQFKLLTANRSDGFREHFGIKNIDAVFSTAQRRFSDWRLGGKGEGTIQQLINILPEHFINLADHLIVARTREVIKNVSNNLYFPKPETPQNFYVTPERIGTLDSFSDLYEMFPPNLAAYSPYLYLSKKEDVNVLEDEWQRDAFLVKMMYILLTKRLESSWYSFFLTLEKIKKKTIDVLEAVKKYEKNNDEQSIKTEVDFADDEDDENEYTIGKREISLKEIYNSGKLEIFKKHLKADIDKMRLLSDNLTDFQNEVNSERTNTSADKKIETLIKKVLEPKKKAENKKVLIFTAFKTTAFYLYKELRKRGIKGVGVISGDESRYFNSDEAHKNFQPIVERFSPYTNLYKEKVWKEFEFNMEDENKNINNYPRWKEWIYQNDPKTKKLLEEEIDVLIATDCLSEGQNLQDCDTVVNYDIHWNPVRVIQRIGRIDRLESPNPSFKVINFWPTENINTYLDLENRIVDRLVASRLTGAEVNPELIERLKQKLKDDVTEESQKAKMLEQMNQSVEELTESKSFGFSDISLDIFRQDLLSTMKEDLRKWEKIPKASFSGFIAVNKEVCPKPGVIALLGYPARTKQSESHFYKHYKLLYLDENGKSVNTNQMEVLAALNKHFKEERNVPKELDRRDIDSIRKYQRIIERYFENCSDPDKEEGKAFQKNIVNNLKSGNKELVDQIQKGDEADNLTDKDKHELLAWIIVQ